MKILVAIFIVVSAATFCSAQDPAKQIAAATDQLEKQLNTSNVSEELKQQCTSDIADIRANLKREFLFLSIYSLRTCQLELASQAYAASKADIKTTEAFEQQWQQLGNELAEKEKLLSQPAAKPLNALVSALVESSQIQVKQYQQSGRLFALNSNMAEGLYYLGRAPANLDLAILMRTLRFPTPKTPATFRSLEPELTKLETASLRTYKSADVSKQQAQFNRLNSNLKVAAELNKASMFEGALLKYLEAELYFGLITASAENEDLEHLRGRLDEAGKLLMDKKADHSIALLFWQMAESSLKPVSGIQPTAAQIKRAVVILNDVIPSYFDYLKEKK
jgi:hypothetical protein